MTMFSSQGSYLPPAGWLDEVTTEKNSPGLLFLLGMAFVGLVLRLLMIDSQSLWVDEIMTWGMVRPGVGLNFWQQTLDSIQGPLYQVALWPLLRWHDTAMMMRLPAALAGAASIPVFGMVAGRLFGGQTARLATVFWVINPFHIWYSQEARGYSFLVLFVLVAAHVFLKMKHEGPTLPQVMAFGLACACAVWSNMSAMFFWGAMGVTWLFAMGGNNHRQKILWLLAFALGLFAVAPWIFKAMGIWAVDRVVPGSDTGVNLRGETTFSILALPYTLFTFFFGYSWGPSLRELHSPDRMAVIRLSWPILLAGAIPMGIGLLTGFFKAHGRRILLLFWILLPVAVLVLLAMRNIKPWNARYVVVVLPWLLMMAAHGFTTLPRKFGLAMGILMGMVTLFSLGNHYFQPKYSKEDIRSAVAWIQDNNEAGDTMLVPVVTSVFNYYYDGPGVVLDTFGYPAIGNNTEADDFIKNAFSNQDLVWVILSREWFFDKHGMVLDSLASSGQLTLEHEQTGVRIFKWKRQHFWER